MKQFFDNSLPLLNPSDIVKTFTGRPDKELALPSRVIIVFDGGDLRRIVQRTGATTINSWAGFRSISKVAGKDVVITRSSFGGPNVAALVEELSAFGASEFVLWGYCGGIDSTLRIGDLLVGTGALREDGVSYHYLGDAEDTIYSGWVGSWLPVTREKGFHEGLIWSCDAIYRETADKMDRYRKRGIRAVEMEVASFYAVCAYKGLKGVAFLVVSDVFLDGVWEGGFRTRPFKKGVQGLTDFMLEKVISEAGRIDAVREND